MNFLQKLLGLGGVAGHAAKGLQHGVGAQLGGGGNMAGRNPIDRQMQQFQPMQPMAQRLPQPQVQSQLQVQPNYGMQGFGHGQEDEFTPRDAMTNQSYNNQQTSLHTGLQQGGFQREFDPQMQQDLIRRLLGY